MDMLYLWILCYANQPKEGKYKLRSSTQVATCTTNLQIESTVGPQLSLFLFLIDSHNKNQELHYDRSA